MSQKQTLPFDTRTLSILLRRLEQDPDASISLPYSIPDFNLHRTYGSSVLYRNGVMLFTGSSPSGTRIQEYGKRLVEKIAKLSHGVIFSYDRTWLHLPESELPRNGKPQVINTYSDAIASAPLDIIVLLEQREGKHLGIELPSKPDLLEELHEPLGTRNGHPAALVRLVSETPLLSYIVGSDVVPQKVYRYVLESLLQRRKVPQE